MIGFTINFSVIFVNTVLMTYFLNKDYKINSHVNKVITYSRYSKIAMFFGYANLGLTCALFYGLQDKFLEPYFNTVGNFIISWILIPCLCVFIYASIAYFTFVQFKFKQKYGIKDK